MKTGLERHFSPRGAWLSIYSNDAMSRAWTFLSKIQAVSLFQMASLFGWMLVVYMDERHL